MLLETEENLQSLLVRILGVNSDLRFDVLMTRLERLAKREYSPQAVYQALRKLQGTGVVTRAAHRYSLSMPWIIRLLEFGRAVEQHYIARSASNMIPQPGAAFTWRFYDLLHTDDFWNHMVLALLKHSGEQEMYEWIPHPWFDLATPGKETQFMNALGITGVRFNMVVGGDSLLDRRCSKGWPKNIFRYVFCADSREFGRKLYLDVIGPFVLSIKFDERVAAEIDSFFAEVRSVGQAEVRRLITILTNKNRIQLRLENNQRRADFYRRRIKSLLSGGQGSFQTA